MENEIKEIEKIIEEYKDSKNVIIKNAFEMLDMCLRMDLLEQYWCLGAASGLEAKREFIEEKKGA